MTTKQLAWSSGLTFDNCNHGVAELTIYALVQCLNPEAQRSRVYGLTRLGHLCRNRLSANSEGVHSYHCPAVSWSLYGWCCFSHRRTCLLTMEGPMQPATIARQAARSHRDRPFEGTRIRMSANNARDVVKLFLKQGLVMAVRIKGKAHTHFTLTQLGRQCQLLLRKAGEKHDLCT